jgi:hypothetical protein
MKKFKSGAALIFLLVFLFSATSCSVYFKKDNGNHNGWYKNSNNPHNSIGSKPGKSEGRLKR